MSIHNYQNFSIAMQENFYMSKKKFPQLHVQINSHIPNKIFPQYPQNLPMPINISMHITTKFCHVHKTKFTRANKLFHIHHEHIHTSLRHKIFKMPMLPKSKPKFIQQHHKLPTLSKFHKPPILSKLHHDK